MKILAIDTTEVGCSAALLYGETVIERFQLTPRQHTAHLLPMVDAVMAEAGLTPKQLDGLGFARGPGSFTGVRIATAAIQGIALATDLPVAPISSLCALAQGAARAYQASHVLAGLDARMHEIYWAACIAGPNGLMQIQGEETVCVPAEISLPGQSGWNGAGSAWAEYADELQDRLGGAVCAIHPKQQIHAQDVATLAQQALRAGHGVGAEQALPVYLRHQVAHKASTT